ncbi:DUF1868 domain-containing protein (plasmid) [Thioclava sp. 'Guangxiensis']|uniref:DUF1868 domain-containing protein n=1 Tax=Thioclava sp. 'Guangxiensis' TaxID=3149044 RepID=UPI0032C43853
MPQRPDPIAHLTGRLSGGPRPSGIALPGGLGKFTPDGAVQPFPGNTFLCHIDPATEQWNALREVMEQIKMSPFARFFTFLPSSSLHMTIFQGVTSANPMPEGLPKGATRAEASALMLDRCADLALPARHRVKVQDLFAAHSFTMIGADPDQEASLRGVRQALRRATGIAPPDFDDYVFHVSLAYLIDWLSESAAREVVAFSTELNTRLVSQIAPIDLGPVEFCHFETMHHFTPIRKFA